MGKCVGEITVGETSDGMVINVLALTEARIFLRFLRNDKWLPNNAGLEVSNALVHRYVL